jgi:hypothetical protein
MEITSTNEQIKFRRDKEGNIIFNLFKSIFQIDPRVELFEYVVQKEDEMRIDIVMSKIYGVSIGEISTYLREIDIILHINGINNPLNIKKGMVIKYPSFAEVGNFRITEEDVDVSNSVKKRLSFPNKKTRKDKSRQEFIDNGYSLPPTVLKTPKDPVRLEDGKFVIGGL